MSPFATLTAIFTGALALNAATEIAAKPREYLRTAANTMLYDAHTLIRHDDGVMYYLNGTAVNWAQLDGHRRTTYNSDTFKSSKNHKQISELTERQTSSPPDCSTQAHKDGDGAPRQRYNFKQATPTITCGEANCQIDKELSTTVGWSASAELADGVGFASLGFSVEESRTEGYTATCSVPEGSTRTCVWYQMDLTEYNAYTEGQCCSNSGGCYSLNDRSDTFFYTAPNDIQCGLTWHCRLDDDCEYEEYEYRIECGPDGESQCASSGDDGFGTLYYQLPAGC